MTVPHKNQKGYSMKTNKETKIENKKVRELTDEEAKQVAGGFVPLFVPDIMSDVVVPLPVSDGNCGTSVSLDSNGKCTSKVAATFGRDLCSTCKYCP